MAKGLIIGGGPSLDFDFVKNFDGLKLVCDTVLQKCVDNDIRPDYVFTLEDISIFWKLFEGVEPLKVVCSERTHKNTLIYLKKNNFKIIRDSWRFNKLVSNVGLFAFCYSWRELKLNEIYLIGMDSCVYEPVTKPYDGILQTHINPDLVKCYLDPIHQLWREQFLDFLELAPKIQVYNYSNGCLFGDKIQWCHLRVLRAS